MCMYICIMCMCIYIYIYMYIERERRIERERERYTLHLGYPGDAGGSGTDGLVPQSCWLLGKLLGQETAGLSLSLGCHLIR